MSKKVITPSEWEQSVKARAAAAGGLPPIAGGSPIMSESVIGVAKEAVYGTFVAPTSFIPGMPNIRSVRNIVRPEQARGYRGFAFDQVVGLESEVTITGALIPDKSFSLLCAACFGSGSDSYSSAAGAATHSLTPQPQLPSLSYEQDTDIVPGEQVLARQVAGCFVDQFQLKMTNQQLVDTTVMMIGQRELTPATPGAPSNVNPTYFASASPFAFSPHLAVQYKGISNTQLLDTTFAVMNHTQRVFAANGQLYATRLVATRREVTLSTLLDFLDTTFYTDWFNGTKTTGFVFTLTSTTNIPTTAIPYSVTFTIPGTRPSGEYAMPVASDVIQQNITFSCTLSGANEVSSVWVNDTAGILC